MSNGQRGGVDRRPVAPRAPAETVVPAAPPIVRDVMTREYLIRVGLLVPGQLSESRPSSWRDEPTFRIDPAGGRLL